jgi:primary-amine oxidase
VAQAAPNPFKDLSAEEIRIAAELIKKSNRFSDGLRFVMISTREPLKEKVLKREAIAREAFLVLYETKKNELYEAIVDLNKQQITHVKRLPEGRQAPMLDEEYARVETLIKADPTWQAALKRRGITQLDQVHIDAWAPGLLSPEETRLKHKIARGLAFFKGDYKNPYARPIEGVVATVDLTENKVMSIWDRKDTIPVAPGGRDFDEASNQPLQQTPSAIVQSQPDGPGFTVSDQQVQWANWSFAFSLHPIQGLVLYHVHFQEPNQPKRSVLYKGSLSEMVVPYGDPDQAWTFRNAFDVGEYGLGKTAHTLDPLVDAPAYARFFDAQLSDDHGDAWVIPRAVAIYERNAGLLWKHMDSDDRTVQARPARQLVVMFATTIGNYDYGVQWVFHPDGVIEVEVFATGILLAKGTVETTNPCVSGCKNLVEPLVQAPNHQHFFSFRLDLDVDGPQNTPVEMNVNTLAPHPERNPAANAFEVVNTLLTLEGMAARDLNPASARFWKVIHATQKNDLGHPTGYKLMPGDNSPLLLHPQSPIRQYAPFTAHSVWFTRFHDGEQSSAGDYPYQGRGNEGGLKDFVSNNESLENQDSVLWYTLGITHITRPEEWPIMNVHRSGFKLVPVNFFSRNPTMNLPAVPQAQIDQALSR